jgi:hypothetical protein
MDHSGSKLELSTLQEHLAKLDITLSRGGDAPLCVFTTSEPLFCFEGNTEAELVELVKDTLLSYVELFYQLGDGDKVVATTTVIPAPKPEVPVFAVNPISKVLLDFSKRGHAQEAHAW